MVAKRLMKSLVS